MAEEPSQRKRVRDGSAESDSPVEKRIREDLLVLLDDTDSAPAGCRESDFDDLDSVMRSFEQELSGAAAGPSPAVVDLTSDSGESLPELGYLLGASDDELGLPSPTETVTVAAERKEKERDRAAELGRVSSESSRLGEFWPFEEGIPGYDDSFGFAIGEQAGNNSGGYEHNGNDYVALDGIFDYSDVNFGPSDCGDTSWWPESLPAL